MFLLKENFYFFLSTQNSACGGLVSRDITLYFT